MGDELRRWPRMALALEVKMRFDNVDSATSAETANISRGGLFIAMNPTKRLGTTVRARIDLGTGETFALEGVVVHSVPDPDDPGAWDGVGPAGVGVFLTNASTGWEEFCEQVRQRKESSDFEPEDTRPERFPRVVERVRKFDTDD